MRKKRGSMASQGSKMNSSYRCDQSELLANSVHSGPINIDIGTSNNSALVTEEDIYKDQEPIMNHEFRNSNSDRLDQFNASL